MGCCSSTGDGSPCGTHWRWVRTSWPSHVRFPASATICSDGRTGREPDHQTYHCIVDATIQFHRNVKETIRTATEGVTPVSPGLVPFTCAGSAKKTQTYPSRSSQGYEVIRIFSTWDAPRSMPECAGSARSCQTASRDMRTPPARRRSSRTTTASPDGGKCRGAPTLVRLRRGTKTRGNRRTTLRLPGSEPRT